MKFIYLFAILILSLDRSYQSNGLDPWFAEKAANITVAEGRTATLPCIVENLGEYKLAWIHKYHKDRQMVLTLDDTVYTNNPRVFIHRRNRRVWLLEIKHVQPEDSGFYICQINTNPIMKQTRHLEVVEDPSLGTTMSARAEYIEDPSLGTTMSARAEYIDILETIPPDSLNSSPTLEPTLMALGAYSAYLLVIRRFVANE